MNLHFLNGQLVPEERLLISPRDLGFTRGYAVFDFLRTYNGRPFRLAEHVARLFASAQSIGLKVPWTPEQVEKWVSDTIAANTDPGEKFIKIIVSGGVSASLVPGGKPTVMVMVDPAPEQPADMYQKGVRVITVRHARYEPTAKTNNYIEAVRQAQAAQAQGALESVYYTDVGVHEGASANVFAVIDGQLLTPATGILSGVTRQVLLDVLKLDMPVRAADFTVEQMRAAPEVFLSASGKEIVPVVSIDGQPVGDGRVGPVTREVMRQFHDYTRSL